MLPYHIMMLISALAFSFSSFAQTKKNAHLKPSPLFTKGYYTIGNHAEKLPHTSFPAADTAVKQVAAKGYYSIQTDTTQPGKLTWFGRGRFRPGFVKGYWVLDPGPLKPREDKEASLSPNP